MINLKEYRISAFAVPDREFVVTAKDQNQAWKKFCAQHFIALHPHPDDYSIVVTGEEPRLPF